MLVSGDKAVEEFRDYSSADPKHPPRVIYELQHLVMTVARVSDLILRLRNAFKSGYVVGYGQRVEEIDQDKLTTEGAVIPMTMAQAAKFNRFMFDATDPDSYKWAQDLHSLQVGLKAKDQSTPHGQFMAWMGFIHDFGKGLAGIIFADQVVVGGDTIALGAPVRRVIGKDRKEVIPYSHLGFDNNPDRINKVYIQDRNAPGYTRYGIYEHLVKAKQMCLDRAVLTFQHDTFLRLILDNLPIASHNLTAEWLYNARMLAAHHSDHLFHDFKTVAAALRGPYNWLGGKKDKDFLRGGLFGEFRDQDLYTKQKIKE